MSGVTYVCPVCRAPLEREDNEFGCPGCGNRFPLAEGCLSFIARRSVGAEAQARWFDEAVDTEFEIERPHGLPVMYQWLISQKFCRGVSGLALQGAHALVVCGGSGMDAEFLARAGAKVVSSDISPGAAARAAERARRHGVEFESIVADVTALPFENQTFDVVYVHDGLHHIEDPLSGVREMARVARHAVCITEPADAFVTHIAVQCKAADEYEEAGNRVARLRLSEVRTILRAEGFRIARSERYAMLYRHEPGLAMRAFSTEPLFSIAKTSFALANFAMGAFGNKLVVQGRRR